MPILLGSPEELYRGRTYITNAKMTRKDKMKEGFVANTFHLPQDLDEEIRVMAVRNHVSFSEEATQAFKEHVSKAKTGGGASKK